MLGNFPFGRGFFADPRDEQQQPVIEQPVCDWPTLQRLLGRKKRPRVQVEPPAPVLIPITIKGRARLVRKPFTCHGSGTMGPADEARAVFELVDWLDHQELCERLRQQQEDALNADRQRRFGEIAEALGLELQRVTVRMEDVKDLPPKPPMPNLRVFDRKPRRETTENYH